MSIRNSLFIAFSVFCLFSITACEDKAEKRTKLIAQIKHSQKEEMSCFYQNGKDETKCQKEMEKTKELKKELDKLNGIK
ncbi:MAG: hypothetical protein J5680_01250 [Neisseriaceae bacterium]|nr:hypothetical protein [Neisseriaceae bacterium]